MDKPHLEIRTAMGRRQLVLGGAAVTIGRHADNEIVVPDQMASRFHCVIEKTPEGYLLRDVGSSNGTLVNGRRVRNTLLSNGDTVTLGSTRLILVLPDAAPRSDIVSTAAARRPPHRPRRMPHEHVATHDEPIELTEADELDGPADLSALEDLGKPIPIAASDGPDDGPVEMLTEADLAEEVPTFMPGDGPISVTHTDDDAANYEQALRSLADSMSDRSFGPGDIVLINPRGLPVAESGRGMSDGPAQTTYLLRLVLLACLRARATDLHVEPKDNYYHARMRVDGVMVDAAKLPAEVGVRLVSATKVVADIDPSQRSIIQEGNFSARVPGGPKTGYGAVKRVDFRVSLAPSVFGQKLVLRLLDPTTAPGNLAELQLAPDVEKELRFGIEQESGMVLVCGPTGSGKTSTLYAMLRSLNLAERNVTTIEDPVEIQIEGATQIPVDDEKGNTFANVLRSVLRQDPDVILVGEIRDAETARIAMQAAITGHLVFSTVHTKDTVGTIFRLLDLGVEPYLLSQGLQLVVAQRLVRKLCPSCKTARPITNDQRNKMGAIAEGVTAVYEPGGCRKCLGTGFAGRRAFFEMLATSDALRHAISHSPSMKEISEALSQTPFKRLRDSGYQLVADGVTPFDEVERAVGR